MFVEISKVDVLALEVLHLGVKIHNYDLNVAIIVAIFGVHGAMVMLIHHQLIVNAGTEHSLVFFGWPGALICRDCIAG